MHESLNDEQAEILEILAEECGELVQACMNILRHGFDSFHPDDPDTDNRELLWGEMADVMSMINAIIHLGYTVNVYETDVVNTLKKKVEWMRHQENLKSSLNVTETRVG